MYKLLIATTTFFFIGSIAQASLKQDIIDRRDQIKSWAPVCKSGPYQGQYSESLKKCKQGDLAIFTGLACLAATLASDEETIETRCKDVSLSQGTNGRWWRGPTRVDNRELDQNAFSRDQSKGVLAYFVARGSKLNKDKAERQSVQDQARRWMQWIDDEGKGKMCLHSTSNLCTILSSDPYAVLKGIDVFPALNSGEFKESNIYKYLFGLQGVFWTLPAETVLTPKGYQLHLKSSSVLIRKSLASTGVVSKAEEEVLDLIAKLIYKIDPQNLYYEFLHKQKVTKKFVKKVFNRCPKELDTPNRYFDWQWTRDVEDQAWKSTNGHDCIFLLNLLLSKM